MTPGAALNRAVDDTEMTEEYSGRHRQPTPATWKAVIVGMLSFLGTLSMLIIDRRTKRRRIA